MPLNPTIREWRANDSRCNATMGWLSLYFEFRYWERKLSE